MIFNFLNISSCRDTYVLTKIGFTVNTYIDIFINHLYFSTERIVSFIYFFLYLEIKKINIFSCDRLIDFFKEYHFPTMVRKFTNYLHLHLNHKSINIYSHLTCFNLYTVLYYLYQWFLKFLKKFNLKFLLIKWPNQFMVTNIIKILKFFTHTCTFYVADLIILFFFFRYFFSYYIDRLAHIHSIFISNYRTVCWRWRKKSNNMYTTSFRGGRRKNNIQSWRYWCLLNQYWYIIVYFFKLIRLKFWFFFNSWVVGHDLLIYDHNFILFFKGDFYHYVNIHSHSWHTFYFEFFYFFT